MKNKLISITVMALMFNQFAYAGVAGKIATKYLQKESQASVLAAQMQRQANLVQAERMRKAYAVQQNTNKVQATVQADKARKTYAIQQNSKRLAAAEQKVKSFAPGVVKTPRPAPNIANDVYKGVSNGKLIKHSSKKNMTLQKNRIAGKIGEMRAYLDHRSAGYKMLPQATAHAGGRHRFVDFVVQHPITKKLSALEIKTGASRYTKSQKAFDKIMKVNGALFKGVNAGLLMGKFRYMTTKVLRY